jgi:ParB-like chromosome segregation protein Spo0J
MTKKVHAAFEMQPVMVRLDDLLQTRPLDDAAKLTTKYKTMEASVREVGIIEPLVVHPQKGGKFLLLDGHARLQVLRTLEHTETLCLVSTDDEAYTYNHKVNRLAPIQANRMIVKALDAGVSDERLARALNLNIVTIRHNRSLLADICPEAIEILKDKQVHQAALRALKKVKAIRQIEMAELMVSSGTYTRAYAQALVMMTPPDLVVESEQAKKEGASRPEDLARMESEIKSLEKDFAMLDESYGRNVVDLTLARGYLKKLLDNGK